MKKIDKFLAKIPVWLSSRISVFIFIFIFVYVVVFVLLAYIFPVLGKLTPSADAQNVAGNYIDILSALGASIAAGSGAAIHKKMTAHQKEHAKLHDKVDKLHEKIDALMGQDGSDLPRQEK